MGAPPIAVRAGRLGNGLQTVLARAAGEGLVVVSVRYRVGSRDDPPGRAGLAHLVEHLLFTGSRHTYRGDYRSFVYPTRALGVNATTAADATTYFQAVPRENLERVLWLESDRMGFMRGQVRAGELELARGVVDNEVRERRRNDAQGALYRRLLNAVYPAPHPYFEPEDGEQLRGVQVADIEAFHARHYAPANASLVLVGDLPAEAEAWVERYFGDLPGGTPPPRSEVPPSPLRGDARVVARSPGPHARVLLGWATPGLLAPGDAEADVLAAIVRQNVGARLVPRAGAIARVTAGQLSLPDTSLLALDAVARPGVGVDAALAEVESAVARLALGEWDASAFAAAQRSLRVGLLHRRQSLFELAAALQSGLSSHGRADADDAELARYAAVTPDAIVASARALQASPRARVLGAPGEAGP